MIKICRSIRIAAAAATATSLLSFSSFTNVCIWERVCVCVCNQQYQNRIYDVPAAFYLWCSSLHSMYFQYGCVCLVPYVALYSKKEIFCRSASSSIEVYMVHGKNESAMDKHMHWLDKWHETPSKQIIIYSIGFLLGSFSKSSFSLFAFFVCLIVCLIHLLCDDLLAIDAYNTHNVTNVERCK